MTRLVLTLYTASGELRSPVRLETRRDVVNITAAGRAALAASRAAVR